jgi:EAL domain-containing protein (putative c-di-GMP-specific phosphodiesterase class I)
MPFPALSDYLSRLPCEPREQETRVWLDHRGRVQGRYFNSSLTSAFQPVRDLATRRIHAYEGFFRSYTPNGNGASLWTLLDHAASDHESIELDRLCRMVHAANFFRQTDSEEADLFVSVHPRLLAAVDADHGIAFRRVLRALELPHERIVLQLPAVSIEHGWLLKFVTENYRRNGFRIAFNAHGALHALTLLDKVRPDYIKLHACEGANVSSTDVVRRIIEQDVGVIFKCVENVQAMEHLMWLLSSLDVPLLVQGFLWDIPRSAVIERVLPMAVTSTVVRHGAV